MNLQERIDAALMDVAATFEADRVSLARLQNTLRKFPNCAPEDTWDALPILFFRGILDVTELNAMPYQDMAVLCHDCHEWMSQKPARWKIFEPRR